MKKNHGTRSHAIGLTGVLLMIMIMIASCSKSSNASGSSGGGGNPNPVAPNAVTIAGMAFSPATITVSAGTTVTWTNSDNMSHTVTADDNSFDSGNIAAGATYSRTFSSIGNFSYHCSIHPNMTGMVMVK